MFILGIGVISVAALFPAGIAQQRHSVDDVIGPVVANNALSVLRSKLRPEDFGSPTVLNVPGDWGWRRPAFYFSDKFITGVSGTVGVPQGSIAIFDNTNAQADTSSELFWNEGLYGLTEGPLVIVTREERQYPMGAKFGKPKTPQYLWECMFRRFQGKVLAAIFVYRASTIGGGAVDPAWSQALADPQGVTNLPPLPVHLELDFGGNASFVGDEWNANAWVVRGTDVGAAGAYVAQDARQSWQEPRQWLLDQNNSVHRVLSQVYDGGSNAIEIELVRPLSEMPQVPAYAFPAGVQDVDANGLWDTDLVSDLWYLPTEIDHPEYGSLQLTPVYLTVREL